MKQLTYRVELEPAEEGGFVVHVPTLDLHTQGETYEEAIAMAKDVIEGHLALLTRDCRWKDSGIEFKYELGQWFKTLKTIVHNTRNFMVSCNDGQTSLQLLLWRWSCFSNYFNYIASTDLLYSSLDNSKV